MTCPPVIADIILDLLSHSILCSRAAGWDGKAEECAITADHIHNLPNLLKNYAPELLKYYWEVERPAFISDCLRLGISVDDYTWRWDRLLDAMRQLPELSWAKRGTSCLSNP